MPRMTEVELRYCWSRDHATRVACEVASAPKMRGGAKKRKRAAFDLYHLPSSQTDHTRHRKLVLTKHGSRVLTQVSYIDVPISPRGQTTLANETGASPELLFNEKAESIDIPLS